MDSRSSRLFGEKWIDVQHILTEIMLKISQTHNLQEVFLAARMLSPGSLSVHELPSSVLSGS